MYVAPSNDTDALAPSVSGAEGGSHCQPCSSSSLSLSLSIWAPPSVSASVAPIVCPTRGAFGANVRKPGSSRLRIRTRTDLGAVRSFACRACTSTSYTLSRLASPGAS